MSMTQSAISRAPRPSSLADVLDLLLDKGLVIDAYVRISALGIEVLTIDARVVVASVDTYLRFAEAVNRLDISHTETQGLPELMQDMRDGGKGEESKVKGALEGGKEALQEWRGERQEERQQGNGRRADDRSADQEEQSSRRSSSRGDGNSGGGNGSSRDEGDRQGLLSRIADRGRWS